MLIRATIRIDISDSRTKTPEPSSKLDAWIAKIENLTTRQLGELAVVLDVLEETDAMRKLFSLLPDLLNPGRSLGKAAEESRAACVQRAYELTTIRDILEGTTAKPETLTQFVARHWRAVNDNGRENGEVTLTHGELETTGDDELDT